MTRHIPQDIRRFMLGEHIKDDVAPGDRAVHRYRQTAEARSQHYRMNQNGKQVVTNCPSATSVDRLRHISTCYPKAVVGIQSAGRSYVPHDPPVQLVRSKMHVIIDFRAPRPPRSDSGRMRTVHTHAGSAPCHNNRTTTGCTTTEEGWIRSEQECQWHGLRLRRCLLQSR